MGKFLSAVSPQLFLLMSEKHLTIGFNEVGVEITEHSVVMA